MVVTAEADMLIVQFKYAHSSGDPLWRLSVKNVYFKVTPSYSGMQSIPGFNQSLDRKNLGVFKFTVRLMMFTIRYAVHIKSLEYSLDFLTLMGFVLII